MSASARGVSTVVDISLCLLLVSAAVATLATATPPAPEDDARARTAASVVATGTLSVTYDVNGTERRANGTAAELLAAAAVLSAPPNGSTGAAFVSRVRNRTRTRLAGFDGRVQVVARWTPYRDAPVSGAVRVGAAPPPVADVDAVTFVVPRERVDAARANEGFGALADTLARDVYERQAAALDGRANRSPTLDALADRLRSDLESSYGTPAAAREALTAGRVRIVVRTWSA